MLPEIKTILYATALGDALLGHTANKLTQRSEIPLLLVRIPEGFE